MSVLDRLGGIFRRRAFYRLQELDSLLEPGQGPLHAVVAMGSFRDVMVRIVARHGEARTHVEVDALDVTTRPLKPRENDAEYLERIVREARLVRECAVAPPEALARFRHELGPGDGFELTDAEQAGMDGYTLCCAVADGRGKTHRFSAWSPREETPHFRFLRALHGLALESLQDWRVLSALDALHSYTGLGERFRDFGGTPRRVRLWGRADSEAWGLAQVERLRMLPDTEPIVLDLRWFHWPPVVLKAALRWAAERPNVRVVVPLPRSRFENALKHEGLPAERTFQLLDEALGEDR